MSRSIRTGVKRLTGAVLYAKVKTECRAILAEYGIPVDEYDIEMLEPYDLGSDLQPVLAFRFKRRSNGRIITFDNIYVGNHGEIDQYSSPELGWAPDPNIREKTS
jgi:hypothetical protein